MSKDTTLVNPANIETVTDSTQAISFGEGRYSPLMAESFKDAKAIFGLSDKAAEKLARQIGSDFGAAMRGTIASTKLGKAITKDGKVTLSEAAKQKGVTLTNALSALRALDYANGAVKMGFNRNQTKWSVNKELGEYLETLND